MMNNILYKIISIIFTFIYIYPIDIGPINSRNIIAVISIFYIIKRILCKEIKISHFIPKKFFIPLIISLLVSICSLFTAFINNVYDPAYVNCFVSVILLMLSSWFLACLYKKSYKKFDMNVLCINITIALHIQFFNSILMYLFPSYNNFIFSIFPQTFNQTEIFESYLGHRLLGIGANFFNLGVINCTFILFITAILKNTQSLLLRKVYTFSIFYFIIIGMMMARTTLLVIPFVFFYYYHNNKNIITLIFKFLVRTSFITMILFLLFNDYISSFYIENEEIFRFAFEHFYNFFEGNGFTSGSTETLASFNAWPDNFYTWIIGDARITDDIGYYMHTDIGYARTIFYFGIIGTILLLMLYFSLAYHASKNCVSYKMFFYLLLFLFFIMFYKGICNIIYIYVLFLFVEDKKSYNPLQFSSSK